jgi:purine-binding chemotaxis protein CheW
MKEIFMGLPNEANIEINETKQYVTFSIGEEMYGIDVGRAQEVLNYTNITHIPNTMSFMKGIIDLRGVIVPLIDIRIKFKLEEKEYDHNTVIIIIEVQGILFGMIVDSVSNVVNVAINDIHNTPHFSQDIDSDSVIGIGRVDGKLLIVLDVDKILTIEEINQIGQN